MTPRATITLTLEEDDLINVAMEFDPEVEDHDGPAPITHHAAMKGAQAILEWLDGDDDSEASS